MDTKPLAHHKKLGSAPGTAIFTGTAADQPAAVRVMAYGTRQLIEDLVEPSRLTSDAYGEHSVRWFDVVGLHDAEAVTQLCQLFGIHSLTVEDILNQSSRLKCEDFSDYLFFSIQAVSLSENSSSPAQDPLHCEPLSILLGPDIVLTFQADDVDVFEPVRRRLRESGGNVRQRGADYLAYALLDAVVDEMFVVLDAIADSVEHIEDELMSEAKLEHVAKIHLVRRNLLTLRRLGAPLREVVGGFQRHEHLVHADTQPFLRDVRDHILQVIETTDLYHNVSDSLNQVYQSRVDKRLNDIMGTLTVIGTIFLPLTFITGLYGMNFDYMPELHSRYGYVFVWVLMLCIGTGMAWFFRRRGLL